MPTFYYIIKFEDGSVLSVGSERSAESYKGLESVKSIVLRELTAYGGWKETKIK